MRNRGCPGRKMGLEDRRERPAGRKGRVGVEPETASGAEKLWVFVKPDFLAQFL